MAMMTRLRGAAVRVPATTSNLGSGFDCLGLAVRRYLEARFEPGAAPFEVIRESGPVELDLGTDLVAESFRARLGELGRADLSGRMIVRSTIPVRRGLGSSAAAILAGLSLAELAARPAAEAAPDAGAPDPEELLRRAARGEGHPDNVAAAVLGGLVAAGPGDGGELAAYRLTLCERVGFAFAAPERGVQTEEARRLLPASVPHSTSARALARLAALLHGLATGDGSAIAEGLRDELHVPYRLKLIDGGPDAIAAAREAGAWGATVSGSGSGILGVCRPGLSSDVAEAMAAAFTGATRGHAVRFPLRPDLDGLRVRAGSAPAPAEA